MGSKHVEDLVKYKNVSVTKVHFVGLHYTTDVIVSNKNSGDFCSMSNFVSCHMIKWFAASKLDINLYKTDVKRFITNSAPHSALHIGCKEKCKYRIS